MITTKFNIKPKILIKSFYNTFLGLLIKNGNLVSAKVLIGSSFYCCSKNNRDTFSFDHL